MATAQALDNISDEWILDDGLRWIADRTADPRINQIQIRDAVVGWVVYRGSNYVRVRQSVPADWIESSIALDRAGKREQALDIIFNHLDDLLLAGDFREVDLAMSRIPVDRMSNAHLLTVLTATAGIRDRPSRKRFYERTKVAIVARGADATNLLIGLE